MAVKSVSTPQVAATITADMASVAAEGTSEVNFTVPGARPGHFYLIKPVVAIAGLVFGAGKSAAVDTVTFTVANVTAGAINPASQDFDVIGF